MNNELTQEEIKEIGKTLTLGQMMGGCPRCGHLCSMNQEEGRCGKCGWDNRDCCDFMGCGEKGYKRTDREHYDKFKSKNKKQKQESK